MEIPKIKMPQIGALNGLKDRLGFSGEESDEYGDNVYQQDGYDDGFGYEDGVDGFEDVSEPFRSNSYDDYGYADDYAAPEPISGAGSRVRPASRAYGSDASRPSSYGSSPKLISLDDVRAHTAAPAGYQRDPLERIRSNTDAGGYRPTTGSASAYRAGSQSAEGQDDVFVRETGAPASRVSEPTRGLNSLFGGAGPTSVSGRALNVVRPTTYEDAEEIAHTLRRGDVVVLDLAVTDPALSKRILDFSFGAASMVNARVDCLARSVFSLQTGDKLNEQELGELRAKGVF